MAGKYDMRRSKKWPDHLTIEEHEVAQAMERAGYKHDPYQTASFVPTRVLYQVYLRYIGSLMYRMDDNEGMPQDLSPRQFGAALCRVLGLERTDRIQRRWHGKKCWGYLGIVGPEAIETRDEPGRPRIDADD
jgi:hypothetical protein